MYNRLQEIIKKIEGNVLAVCLDDKLIDMLNKNNKVNLYSIESNNNKLSNFKSNKKRKTNKGKSINIKKLRKHINKKSVNYLFCNMNEMLPYYKYFIKDSIYLNNNIIYLYFDKNIELDFILDKYKRYNVKIEKVEFKNGYILKIDNTNGKNYYFKDKLYFIKDTLFNIAETIGNIMIS